MLSDARLRFATAALGGLACCITVLASACTRDRDDFASGPGPLTADASPPDAGSCGYRCSRNLKTVFRQCDDGPEETIATCGPDQGCGIDKCVDACTSAELSKGSTGCSFWTLPADDEAVWLTAKCFAAMIANTWDRPVTVRAALRHRASQPLSASVYTVSRADQEIRSTRQLEGDQSHRVRWP